MELIDLVKRSVYRRLARQWLMGEVLWKCSAYTQYCDFVQAGCEKIRIQHEALRREEFHRNATRIPAKQAYFQAKILLNGFESFLVAGAFYPVSPWGQPSNFTRLRERSFDPLLFQKLYAHTLITR